MILWKPLKPNFIVFRSKEQIAEIFNQKQVIFSPTKKGKNEKKKKS